MRKPCSIENCNRPHVGRGFCNLHWKRWRLHGNPLAIMPVGRASIPLSKRFWEKVQQLSDTDSCWPWQGNRDKRGYGRVQVNKKLDKAHRVAYTLTYGSIPDGLHVLHHCDNPPCVRPDHLFVGTAKDNVSDCISKGRWRTYKGPRSWVERNPITGRFI